MEFTCIKCEFKFHETKMDTDERMCYDCLEEDDTEPTTADEYNKVQDYGPPYSMANPTGEPVGAQHYPEWDCEKGCYILPKKKGIQKDPEC
jgi:hypothetical protein|tara:strand:+ start:4475 stop:4747 length:273 start_codon:yes stop_codon:yes gene_type:complete